MSKLDEVIAHQRTVQLTDEERAAFLSMGNESLDTDTRVSAMRSLLGSSGNSRAFMADFFELLFRHNMGERPAQHDSALQEIHA